MVLFLELIIKNRKIEKIEIKGKFKEKSKRKIRKKN